MKDVLILAFGVVLMGAVLLSERARRTVLSTSVMFLVAGFFLGNGVLRVVHLQPTGGIVEGFADLALFVILFVDGAELPARDIASAWRLPGRALLIGMPVTLGAIAVAAHFLLGIGWVDALLVGAVLSPTDPVFVRAILEREAVPLRLRRVLSVESGLNDGLALPAVMILIAVAGGGDAAPWRSVLDAVLGLVVGVVVPAVFLWLERRRVFGAAEEYRPLAAVAIACALWAIGKLTGINEFLAAFAGGVTIASFRGPVAEELLRHGAPVAEALKLAALLVFGAVLSLPFLFGTGFFGVLFAVVALVAARPIGFVFAFIGGGLARKEWLAAAWFGPKGFASLLYAVFVLRSGIPHAAYLFQAVALVVVLSIIAHSSSDVAVARVFCEAEDEKAHGTA